MFFFGSYAIFCDFHFFGPLICLGKIGVGEIWWSGSCDLRLENLKTHRHVLVCKILNNTPITKTSYMEQTFLTADSPRNV